MTVRIVLLAGALAGLASPASVQVVPGGSVAAQPVPKEDFTGTVVLRPPPDRR